MRRSSDALRTIAIACSLLAVFGVARPANAEPDADEEASERIVALVHERNPVERLSLHDVRLLYGLYRRSWEGGVRVVLVLPLHDSPAMDWLAAKVLRETDAGAVERYYHTAMFQQRTAAAPASASTLGAASIVRSERGAIALVARGEATDLPGVRVIEISDD